MTQFGQLLPFVVAAESCGKPALTRRPARLAIPRRRRRPPGALADARETLDAGQSRRRGDSRPPQLPSVRATKDVLRCAGRRTVALDLLSVNIDSLRAPIHFRSAQRTRTEIVELPAAPLLSVTVSFALKLPVLA